MEAGVANPTIEVILARKSVRHFTGRMVNDADLEKLLRAAMAAPAAVGMAPWKFIVIREREKLQVLTDELPFAKMLVKAGTAIVVCAAPAEAPLSSEAFAVMDCSCASQNILLAAEALGLGAVWTAVYPNKELMSFVRKTLRIPENIIPLNIIPVGFPTGEDEAHDKFQPHNIHWSQW